MALLSADAGPGLPQNSASQKAAALTAIAALSKRLTGGASIASFTDNRGHSPPRYCMHYSAKHTAALQALHCFCTRTSLDRVCTLPVLTWMLAWCICQLWL